MIKRRQCFPFIGVNVIQFWSVRRLPSSNTNQARWDTTQTKAQSIAEPSGERNNFLVWLKAREIVRLLHSIPTQWAEVKFRGELKTRWWSEFAVKVKILSLLSKNIHHCVPRYQQFLAIFFESSFVMKLELYLYLISFECNLVLSHFLLIIWFHNFSLNHSLSYSSINFNNSCPLQLYIF